MSDLWMPYILTDFNGQNQIVSILDYEREKDRVLHINGEINDFMAQILTAQIRYLESKSRRYHIDDQQSRWFRQRRACNRRCYGEFSL